MSVEFVDNKSIAYACEYVERFFKLVSTCLTMPSPLERQLVSIAKQFGDMGVKADLVESKGKTFVAFNGTDQNGRVLKYAFVNGTRINMNGKKYPLNSFKAMQAGFSPKSRAENFKGAGVLTFVVSASIATSDLVFKDDYHLFIDLVMLAPTCLRHWFSLVWGRWFLLLMQSLRLLGPSMT